ncbi:YibE/F family protein, partial [Candidatus Falkowbacteria bacterium]|nr:YibE/F family protein [Candidatus Falkowbacteria bacterium]
LAVGGFKGLRSLLSLVLSFFVIMDFIIPKILAGSDPVLITVAGSFFILIFIIYLTEGFNRLAHISVLSIFLSLLTTVLLSWFFVDITKLSGLATEDASFLIGLGNGDISFQGLLMAGIIIGALGVLDDVVISQVAAVSELYITDSTLSRWDLFSRAYKVGVSHISSMTNTLFLAYAGASITLLILFSSGQSGFSSWGQAVNNEMIATEIVRTLAGSIGLILAVPISTYLAVWAIKRK